MWRHDRQPNEDFGSWCFKLCRKQVISYELEDYLMVEEGKCIYLYYFHFYFLESQL